MRRRSTLVIISCLLLASATASVTAQEPPSKERTVRFERMSLWDGLLAWIAEYGLQADPDGISVSNPAAGGDEGTPVANKPEFDCTIR